MGVCSLPPTSEKNSQKSFETSNGSEMVLFSTKNLK